MFYRTNVLKDRQTLQDTFRVDVDLKGIAAISALDVIVRANNGGTSCTGNPLFQEVDAIEVLDGSKVIFSLSGAQARALNAYELADVAPAYYHEGASTTQEETFRVHFGRWLGDDAYWFDPAMFQNPILRISGSLTISATVGYATGTGDLTVISYQWDTRPGNRRGHMQAREYRSFTSAASGDDPTTLPLDLPHRLLCVRAYESGIAMDANITNLKLQADQGASVLWQGRMTHLRDVCGGIYGQRSIMTAVLRADNQACPTWLGFPRELTYSPLADFNVGGVESLAGDLATLGLYLLSATPTIAKDATARTGVLQARGFAPYNTLVIPTGWKDDPSSWLEPSAYGKLELTLTQGNAGAAVSVFGQQVAP